MVSQHKVKAQAIAALALLVISACSSGASVGAMTAPVTDETLISQASPAYRAISVGDVIGGKETNPLGVTQVSDANFRAALLQSLQVHAMSAPDRGQYILSAQLLAWGQPAIGLNSTADARVHYKLVASDGSTKLDDVVETSYTAKLADAFSGVERLRLANEGAMQANIEALLKKAIAILQGS